VVDRREKIAVIADPRRKLELAVGHRHDGMRGHARAQGRVAAKQRERRAAQTRHLRRIEVHQPVERTFAACRCGFGRFRQKPRLMACRDIENGMAYRNAGTRCAATPCFEYAERKILDRKRRAFSVRRRHPALRGWFVSLVEGLPFTASFGRYDGPICSCDK
jgi:hypothetical protein